MSDGVVVPIETKRGRMSGRERRTQLIQIGRQVFAERGFEAASVEDIADRAGVSKPIVYEHFGGKEGLYAVIVDHEVNKLLARIEGALEADHPHRALEQAAEAFLGYVEEEEDGFRILVRDAPLGIESGTLPSVMGDIAAKVEGLLASEFKKRDYDRKIAPVMARALVGMVGLAGQWWVETKKPKRAIVAAQLVNLAWNGLKDLDHDPVRTAKKRGSKKNND